MSPRVTESEPGRPSRPIVVRIVGEPPGRSDADYEIEKWRWLRRLYARINVPILVLALAGAVATTPPVWWAIIGGLLGVCLIGLWRIDRLVRRASGSGPGGGR